MDYSLTSSEELVQACLHSQNHAAWLEFVKRFQPLIAGVLLRTARHFGETSPSGIDDLVQEVFLKLCRDDARLLREFKSTRPDSIFGFVKVVTANLAHDHFKARNSLKRGSGAVLDCGIDNVDHEAVKLPLARDLNLYENKVLLSQIDACLKPVDSSPTLARDRRIFWLHYRVGLSSATISSLPGMDLTVKGVESSLLRTTRMVRQKLAGTERLVEGKTPPPKGIQPPEAF